MQDVLEAYASAAQTLIERFNAVSPDELFNPLVDLFPADPVRVVDIGAGPGRDAAWFTAKGHSVLAVEPVREFREAGLTAHSSRIQWIDDRLPELTETRRRGPFDLVLLCAVWQHLDEGQRPLAMRNLAELIAPGGLLAMSLRHGPGAADRPVHPTAPEETIACAATHGLVLLRRIEAPSVQPINQQNDVTWTWLAFRAQTPGKMTATHS